MMRRAHTTTRQYFLPEGLIRYTSGYTFEDQKCIGFTLVSKKKSRPYQKPDYQTLLSAYKPLAAIEVTQLSPLDVVEVAQLSPLAAREKYVDWEYLFHIPGLSDIFYRFFNYIDYGNALGISKYFYSFTKNYLNTHIVYDYWTEIFSLPEFFELFPHTTVCRYPLLEKYRHNPPYEISEITFLGRSFLKVLVLNYHNLRRLQCFSPELIELFLTGCLFVNTSMFPHMPYLEKLSMTEINLSNVDQSLLLNTPNLKTLHISGMVISPEVLAQLPYLVELYITDICITDALLMCIGSTNISTLALRCCLHGVTDAGMSAIFNDKLKYLNLYNCTKTDGITIASQPGLKSIPRLCMDGWENHPVLHEVCTLCNKIKYIVDDHTDACDEVYIQCYHCNISVKRKNIAEHELHCTDMNLDSTCEWCNVLCKYENYLQHRKRCPMRPFNCTTCGFTKIPYNLHKKFLRKGHLTDDEWKIAQSYNPSLRFDCCEKLDRHQLQDLKNKHLAKSEEQCIEFIIKTKSIIDEIEQYYTRYFSNRVQTLDEVKSRDEAFGDIIETKRSKLRKLAVRPKFSRRFSKKLAFHNRMKFEVVHTKLRVFRHILLLWSGHRRHILNNWQIAYSSDDYTDSDDERRYYDEGYYD